MSPLTQVLIVAAGTYLIRVSAIAVVGRTGPPPESVQATLRLVAPAVLAAIVADRVLLVDGRFEVRWDWYLAAAVAAGVAWRWRAPGWSMASGLIVIWVVAALT